MATGAESFLHGLLCSYEHVGTGAHASRNQHRLAVVANLGRQRWMTRRKSACCSLAVHQHLLAHGAYLVLLALGNVVAHVVDHPEFAASQNTLKRLPCPVSNHLPI